MGTSLRMGKVSVRLYFIICNKTVQPIPWVPHLALSGTCEEVGDVLMDSWGANAMILVTMSLGNKWIKRQEDSHCSINL